MKIIPISGKARSGKEVTAEFLKSALTNRGERVLIAHYADLVKYICKSFFDWDGIKDEKGRSLLQYVGTDIVRTQKPDYWVDFICDIAEMFDDKWDYILIPDCRFPNEIEKCEKRGFNTVHIRVIRPNFDNGLTLEQQSHASEVSLDDYQPDIEIINSGSLEVLQERVELISKIL